ERGNPGRLRRSDHTSHAKIISSVTSSYGTALRPKRAVNFPRGLMALPNPPIFSRASDHRSLFGRASRISLNSASVSDSRSEYSHGLSSATGLDPES
ncbi:hypothetical protein ACFV3O_01595, partial [Streptomyces albidoflavus]